MDNDNKGGKKMPVVIEISDLENVSGGALPVFNPTKLTPSLVANRCPATSPIVVTKLTVIRPGFGS